MRLTFPSTVLAVCSTAHLASGLSIPLTDLLPALPLAKFELFSLVKPLTLEEARKPNSTSQNESPEPKMQMLATTAATCSNPRIRREWDSYSTDDRRAYVSAIKCLMAAKPSGQFPASASRYEDLVALHQKLTPNVHENDKFLIWHRYLLFTFEDLLRSECGFNRELPWFDETRYAGRFAQSSIFSGDYLGAIATGGDCVRNGQFANLAINIGPGPEAQNTPHCLARNGDGAKTANCNAEMVNTCNAHTTFHDMAWCAERGAHAWGHNGVGAVMQDTYASPADPFFWLHHAFIDRNFRIWQNADRSRVSNIDGTDSAGNRLTLDTTVNVYGIRRDVRIREILDTTAETLCYKYNY